MKGMILMPKMTPYFLFNGNLVNKTTLANLESSGLISLDTILKLNTEKLILIEIKDFKNTNNKKILL